MLTFCTILPYSMCKCTVYDREKCTLHAAVCAQYINCVISSYAKFKHNTQTVFTLCLVGERKSPFSSNGNGTQTFALKRFYGKDVPNKVVERVGVWVARHVHAFAPLVCICAFLYTVMCSESPAVVVWGPHGFHHLLCSTVFSVEQTAELTGFRSHSQTTSKEKKKKSH